MATSAESKGKRGGSTPPSVSPGAPAGLWLIDAQTGFPYAPLNDGATIDLSNPFFPWNLDVGYFTHDTIDSVVYKVTGPCGYTSNPKAPPYRLLPYCPADIPIDNPSADGPGFAAAFPPGHYTITATPSTGKMPKVLGTPLTVTFTVSQSIVCVKGTLESVGKYKIQPFRVNNQGTSSVSLYGPHLYPVGKHILAQGSPPLQFGIPLNEEFTVPGGNINFVTTFSWRSNKDKDPISCTSQTLEHPGGSPFVLQPGQSLDLQVVNPIEKPRPPTHAHSGVGGGSGPGQHHPPLP